MAAHPAFLKAYKDLVEKPGESAHTAKWDRCVEEVKAKGNGANAYAVCTAMLGDESFKAMSDADFSKELDMFLHKLGIAGAGPVPESLLSRQDLERGARKSSAFVRKSEGSHDLTVEIINGSEGPSSSAALKDGSSSFSVWYHDAEGNRKCEVYTNIVEAKAAEERLTEAGFKDVYCISSQDEQPAEKSAVEQTGKQLDRAVRAATKAEDTEDAETLATRIKNIQLKRQKATIAARTRAEKGTFKNVWGALNKNAL